MIEGHHGPVQVHPLPCGGQFTNTVITLLGDDPSVFVTHHLPGATHAPKTTYHDCQDGQGQPELKASMSKGTRTTFKRIEYWHLCGNLRFIPLNQSFLKLFL
jgi:hypothetical protein